MRPGAFAPVEPTAPDAQELLLDELADPAYAAAQPTWFDLLSQAVLDWFQSLQFAPGEGPPVLALVIGGVLVALAVLVAILVYGLPRRRTRSRAAGELFGESDRRSVKELRRASITAASRGDHALAIAERFRALARALDERTLLSVMPGTTAHEAARQAARAFPAEREALDAGADAFDGVRYQGRAGDQGAYEALRMLDERLQQAQPILPSAGAPGSAAGPGSSPAPSRAGAPS